LIPRAGLTEVACYANPLRLGDACLERIAVGLETYMAVAADRARAPQSRASAITILASLREHRAKWLPLLERIHADEPAPRMRAHLAYCFDDEHRRASR
jgi:hypothetical protein